MKHTLAVLPELVGAALALYLLAQPTTTYRYPTSSDRVDTVQLRSTPSPTQVMCWYEPDVNEHLFGLRDRMPANGVPENCPN